MGLIEKLSDKLCILQCLVLNIVLTIAVLVLLVANTAWLLHHKDYKQNLDNRDVMVAEDLRMVSKFNHIMDTLHEIEGKVDKQNVKPGYIDMRMTCNNEVIELYADGKLLPVDDEEAASWSSISTVKLPNTTRILAVRCRDYGVVAGLLIYTPNGLITDDRWKCTTTLESDWMKDNFNDSDWPRAVKQPVFHAWADVIFDIGDAAWIWTGYKHDPEVFCRANLTQF